MWYVIQTRTGQERKIKTIIENTLSPEVYSDCKIIYYEMMRKYQGKWHAEKRAMFPGYLFVESDDVEELFHQLRRIPELTKLLGYGKDIVAISKEEEEFLRRITGGDDTVEMSYGVQEGDRVVVNEGCLVGLESIIRKIDRHKRRAFIDVEILGVTRQVEIGLEIVEKA